jgi:DSF synthase
MALSHSFVRGLQDAVNDNLDLLPSDYRRLPASVVPLRQPKLDVELPTLAARLEAETGILWAQMKHQDRGCYTPALVSDSRSYQLYLKEQCGHLAADEMPFKYLVWTSEAKGVFSLGGDLAFFTHCVREGRERQLTEYAHRCIDVLHDNYNAMGLPVLTCALVTGDAIGGGLESMITNDIVVAEKGAKFGLPEILFNLFPGMGGYSYLVRKIGEKQARAFVEDGRSRSAEEMVELGLVDVLAEPGQGEQALRDYLGQGRRFNTMRTIRRACKRVDPVQKGELLEIVDIWVDLAMQLSADDLRRMDCLARVQEKKRVKA